MSRDDVEALARRIARGDRSSRTASMYARAAFLSEGALPPVHDAPAGKEPNVNGCTFAFVGGGARVGDGYAHTPADLVEVARAANASQGEDLGIRERDYQDLYRWALYARPGDVIDGWWEITWIFAIRWDWDSDRRREENPEFATFLRRHGPR